MVSYSERNLITITTKYEQLVCCSYNVYFKYIIQGYYSSILFGHIIQG